MNVHYWFLLLFFMTAVSDGSASPAGPPSPLEPSKALETIEVPEGLRVELVAAEPNVFDPVAMAFDEKGRIYVAEDRGYPTGPGKGNPPVGTIALLTDEDGDGYYENRVTFAEGLNFPNGVMAFRGGVLVTDAPDLLFLKDTDGDNRADLREVLITGFSEGGSTQLRFSHPILGPDGWIYLTNGLSGGKAYSPLFPDRPPLENRLQDWRFNPETGEIQAVAGRAQFGQSFDDFGRKFVCSNRKPIEHVVLQNRYLTRNPNFAFTSMVETLMGGPDTPAPLFPISDNITTADSHAGTFTAACGLLIYRGDALPEDYRGDFFVCDPTGNLVHRGKLVPRGATFAARRVRDGVEFLASTDNWFRPVNLAHGPDGALYICDMYRKTIEHPAYLPKAIAAITDFESGKQQGRIYRVVPERPLSSDEAKVLASSKGDLKQLVGLLSGSNPWVRETAYRLILEKKAPETAALLRKSLETADSPHHRLHLLYGLSYFGGLNEEILLRGIADPHPGVRENAVRLAEPFLEESEKLRRCLLELAEDPDHRVRFQTALALGVLSTTDTVPALVRVAVSGIEDPWTHSAVLCSLAGREPLFLEKWVEVLPGESTGTLELMNRLGHVLGKTKEPERMKKILELALSSSEAKGSEWSIALLNGIAEGGTWKGKSDTDLPALNRLVNTIAPNEPLWAEKLSDLAGICLEESWDLEEPLSRRLSAITFLGYVSSSRGAERLASLLDPVEPREIQMAAIRALSNLPGERVADIILDRESWPTYTPAVKDAAVAAMLSHKDRIHSLLKAVEDGRIPATAIVPAHRDRLLNSKDPEIKNNAEKAFGSVTATDRWKVYEDYQSVLELEPDPGNGRRVFKKNCSQCHRLDGEGIEVGPDLFSVRNKEPEVLLLHILVPNYEMVPGYNTYLVETFEGETMTGLIVSETPVSLTLRWAGGEQTTILREEIETIRSTSLSLMPEELEKNMTRQEIRDLLSYLRGEGVRKGEKPPVPVLEETKARPGTGNPALQ